MASYTITLEYALTLMTPTQRQQFDELLEQCAPTIETKDAFKTAFILKYNNREVQAGTPAGFLIDLSEDVALYKNIINELFNQYIDNGLFSVKYIERKFDQTETPNITHTRTPNITRTRTPNLTNTSNNTDIFSDTPDSSGVVSGNYASTVDKQNGQITQTGTETNAETGTETNRETGERQIHSTETRTTPAPRLFEILDNVPDLFNTILRLFADCFIMLY